ncbi:MAG: hypothetical protein ACOYJJ_04370 [Anaerovoracaceae bacterium]|jgi:tetratricopeptide (TPR) repeat protein
MDVSEAWNIFLDYYRKNAPTQLDKDAFIEASEFLIYSNSDWYEEDRAVVIYNLASFYYDEDQFPLARKYYELLIDESEKKGDRRTLSMAQTCLGYYYYYGHDETGPDYDKAYLYACEAAEDKSNLRALWLKTAAIGFGNIIPDMTVHEYGELVFQTFDTVMRRQVNGVWSIPVPEVKMLFADYILIASEGKQQEDAHKLLREARSYLFRRLLNSKDPDDLLLMHQIVDMDPILTDEDVRNVDIYDFFWLLHNNMFYFDFCGKSFVVVAQEVEGQQAIKFEEKWYRSIDDFFRKADINHQGLNFIADQISDICEVEGPAFE